MDVILDIIDSVFDGLIEHTLKLLVTDSMYQRGFVTALVLGYLLGKLYSVIMRAYGQILAFFQPSALPATRPGPSGADRAKGCSSGFLKLVAVSIGLIIFVATLVVALTH
jgi:hypothetical protein